MLNSDNFTELFIYQENESDSESWQPEADEADVLYYYNHTSSQQNIDCLSDNGAGQDVEKVCCYIQKVLISYYTFK